MATIKVTKGWIEQYFGIKIDRPEQYSSYWQTDGGTATRDFDRLPENEYELVHRASSKTYWGKYVHPTVPVVEAKKFLLELTREQLINDLSKVFREQNDVSSMSDEKLIEAWKWHGIHTGTWDWDEVMIVDEEGNPTKKSLKPKRLMKIMKVKYERTTGGAHSEMGSARINPITGKREFHPWSGLGTFGKEVFEGETYELVDLKTGSWIDPSESGDVIYDPRIGRCIRAVTGKLVDIMRVEDFTSNNSPEDQRKLLALEFETKYNDEYVRESMQSPSKTGVRAHKEYLQKLEDEYRKLGRKFEAGTIMDFEKDRMDNIALEIKRRRQELGRL